MANPDRPIRNLHVGALTSPLSPNTPSLTLTRARSQSFLGPKMNVLMKVVADQTAWSILLNTCYCTVVLCVPPRLSREK
jgi:hypothetical protein